MTRARWVMIRAALCALPVILACGLVCAAPSTRPVEAAKIAATPQSSLPSMDSQLIRRGTSQTPASGAAPSSPIMSLEGPRVAIALAAVVALIFVLRSIARRFFDMPGAQRSSRAVQVLSRSIISPKQHILLVQIGRRVLVVGDSGGQMNSLCQITDGEEIAALVGQVREEKLACSAKLFGSFFNRARERLDEDEPEENDSVASDDQTPEIPEDDSSLVSTREELTGLMEKVRLVSRQFHKG